MNKNTHRNNPAYNLNKAGTPPGLKILAEAGIPITPAIYAAFMAPAAVTCTDLVRRHGQIVLGPDFDLNHNDGARQFQPGHQRQIAHILIDLVHFAGQIPVCDLPADFGQTFLDHVEKTRALAGRKFKAATSAKIAAAAGGPFRTGMEARLCSHDPFRDLARLLARRPVVVASPALRSAEEINLILETAYAHDKLIFVSMVLARLLGARRRELLEIRRNDLHEKMAGAAIPSDGRHSKRMVAMPAVAVELMELLPTIDPQNRMIPLTAEQFVRRMAAIAKKAGVSPLAKDDLRRWFSMQQQWGLDAGIRHALLGHSKSAITHGFYQDGGVLSFEAVVKRLLGRKPKPFLREDLV